MLTRDRFFLLPYHIERIKSKKKRGKNKGYFSVDTWIIAPSSQSNLKKREGMFKLRRVIKFPLIA
jgi:hypothetical protein